MKKILLGVAALLGVAIAGAVIGPSFIDWNNYKSQIAQQAAEVTGRAVQIDGDISLRIVPAPELSAKGLRIANLEQGSDADMATVEQLQVRVAFWPLLKGQLQVESVSLISPKILLETYADGRNNWTFGAASDEVGGADAAAAADPRTSQRVREETAADRAEDTLKIDSLSLRGATLVYRNAGRNVEERLENLDADVLAESLKGPFSLKGKGRYRGHDADFEIVSGRWVEAGATQLSASLALPAQAARAQFSGTVSRHIEGVSLRGISKLAGGNLGALLVTAGLQSETPAALSNPFRLESEISADSQRLTASKMIIALGDAEVSGEVELEHQMPRKVNVSLNASRLDLDSLFEASASAGGADRGDNSNSAARTSSQISTASPSNGTAASPGEGGFVIPQDLEASVQIVVDAAIYRQQVLRQILFSAAVTDGRLVIGEAAALLPGGSDIALSGMLTTPEGVPNFDGRLDAAADNLRGVLQWGGIDVGAVPADRLRKTTFSSRVTATPDLVTLSDMDLLVDVTRINGGVSVAVRERPGFGIGLAIDRLDLDAYLPQNAAATPDGKDAVAVGQSADTPAASENPVQAGAGSGSSEGALPDLTFLDRFDANLDFRINSLDYRGASLRNLHLDGTLQAASLILRKLDAADLSGAAIQAAGRVDALTQEPMVDGRVTLKVDEPSRLEAVLGKAARDMERLGAFTLETTLVGSLQDLSIDGKLAAQGGQASAKGQLRSVTSNPSFNLSLDAKHPDFNGLARVLVPDAGISAGPGAFALTGQLTGSPARVQLSNLNLRAGRLTAEGDLGADFSSETPRVSLDLSTGEIRTSDLKSGGDKRGSGRASGSASRTSGAKRTGGAAGSGTGAAADLSGVHRRWSRDPVDLSGLAQVDGDIAIRSKAIIADDLRLDNTTLEAALNGGVLSIARFAADVYGGKLTASGSVDGRNSAAVDLQVDATGLNAGRLVRDLSESDRIAGTLDLSAKLKADGESEAALVRSLSGSGRLGGQMTARVKAEEQLGNVVLGILGTKVKEIRGVSDATTALFSAFAGTPAQLSGTFKIQQGVVETVDTRIDGRDASIFTAGKADLPAWLLSSRSDLFRSQDANQIDPYVIAEANGALDAPNVKVRGEAFKRKSSGSSGTSSSPQRVNPEDAIRGLLKDLVR